MKFETDLLRGRLIKRYKRFLADVELEDGSVVTAHCANSGSMMGLKDPGMTVWLSPANNPKRKLQYTWELVEFEGQPVGIHTSHPNALVEEAILAGKIPALEGYDALKREKKYGKNSRIDIFLSGEGKPDTYVEVKNVTLMRDSGIAEFPDAVTARGAKHLGELAEMVAQGHRAVMFYLVQRMDCTTFKLAADIDPTYASAFEEATQAGVEVLCYACHIDPTQGIEITQALSVDT